MPKNRFFLDAPFEKGLLVELLGEELHHLRVMRCFEGDLIELVNGRNQLGKGEILSLQKQSAQISLKEVDSFSPVKKQLILVQALLLPKNLDLVLEKGTELGATAFWLFPGERSEKKSLSPTQLHRCRSLTIAALKQCGRLDLPEIRLMPPLSQWATTPPGDSFYGDPDSKISFAPSSGPMSLFVGPEKGFSPQEEKLLSQWAQGVRIHPYVLRAETATLCFLSLAITGDSNWVDY